MFVYSMANQEDWRNHSVWCNELPMPEFRFFEHFDSFAFRDLPRQHFQCEWASASIWSLGVTVQMPCGEEPRRIPPPPRPRPKLTRLLAQCGPGRRLQIPQLDLQGQDRGHLLEAFASQSETSEGPIQAECAIVRAWAGGWAGG